MSDRFSPGPDPDSPNPDQTPDIQPGADFGGADANEDPDAWGDAEDIVDSVALDAPERERGARASAGNRASTDDGDGAPERDDETPTSQPPSHTSSQNWALRAILWGSPLIFLAAGAVIYTTVTGYTILTYGTAEKLLLGVLGLMSLLGTIAYVTTGPKG